MANAPPTASPGRRPNPARTSDQRSSFEPGAGRDRSRRGRTAHIATNAARMATLVANSVCWGAANRAATTPTPAP